MQTTEFDIRIPNEASIHTLRNFLGANQFFPPNPASFRLQFHPRFVYIQPFVLSMLAAWGNFWKSQGAQIRCQNLKAGGVDYAWRMGLFKMLDIAYTPRREEHEEAGRFIPLTRIASGADLTRFLTDVAALLHRPEHVAAVQYCLSETIRNVLEHAGGVPAFACAQYYPNARRISIGVADCGVGILKSLSQYNAVNEDRSALTLALTPGITGAPRGMYGPSDNAGVGLFFTKSIAKSSRQYFAILSGTAAYRLRRIRTKDNFALYTDPTRDRHDLFDGLPSWKGTAVAVDIGIRQQRTFESTMAAIREAISERKPARLLSKVKFT